MVFLREIRLPDEPLDFRLAIARGIAATEGETIFAVSGYRNR